MISEESCEIGDWSDENVFFALHPVSYKHIEWLLEFTIRLKREGEPAN